jgi:peptidase E
MKQIIALGGGGFSMEPDNPLLDQYVLRQTGKPRPKICFFPHATDDATRYAFRFFDAFSRLECAPSTLSLYQTPPMRDMAGFLLEQDAIYVGGGNTKSMLALWREWGLDVILRQCYEAGVVLAGISAGANCWFQEFVTDSATPELNVMKNGLGFLPGSFCPHYDGEPQRRPTYRRKIAEGAIKAGIACEDNAAAHYVDGALVRVVSSKVQSKGYALRQVSEGFDERALETTYLGNLAGFNDSDRHLRG